MADDGVAVAERIVSAGVFQGSGMVRRIIAFLLPRQTELAPVIVAGKHKVEPVVHKLFHEFRAVVQENAVSGRIASL